MTNTSMRALRWVAPIALVGAIGLAACGDGGSDETIRTETPGEIALGSDQHLVNQANEIANQVRSNRAQSARLTAAAERYERQAGLDGSAETHGPDSSTDEFVPGSRRMPL